jgi:carbon storage regulator CsrA
MNLQAGVFLTIVGINALFLASASFGRPDVAAASRDEPASRSRLPLDGFTGSGKETQVMLVLSRRLNEKILLPSIHTSVEVLDIKGDRVRLGIEAPTSVTILREELAGRQAPGASDRQTTAAAKRPMEATLDAVEALARQNRHQLRNHLNSATIGIALAQRQLQEGQVAQAESTLAKISLGVGKMTQQLNQVLATGQPRQEAPRQAAPKALLVEDQDNECQLLAGLIRLAGYEVATAGDGVAALDYLHQHGCPDVMLLDMMLPRCDGPTTVRRLRDEPAFNDLKIYAISGHTPDEVGFDYRASGVARWFQKPLDPELLLRELSATRLTSVAV